MRSRGKYRIVTGITTEYKINPENPKYFAKFVNDNISCYANTEKEAIEGLKKLFDEYKVKNKLHGLMSNKVLNAHVSTERSEKYLSTSMSFFGLIGEDDCIQIDDEYTVEDFEFSKEQIELINTTYGLNIQPEDILVDIFEKINKSNA